jgi:hypothetical protein
MKMGVAFGVAIARAFRSADWPRYTRYLAVSLLLVGIVGTASASTAYNVNLQIGSTGTATGDIVTDGTVGNIGAANIIDWNLILNDGVSGAVNLLGPSSGNNSFVALNGLAVSATASALLFDFSSPSAADAYLYFESNGLPVTFLCFGGGGAGGYSGNCASAQPGNVEAIEDQGGSIQSTLLSGTQPIATTPLPAALPLFATGLGALGLLGWRRKRKAAALAAA